MFIIMCICKLFDSECYTRKWPSREFGAVVKRVEKTELEDRAQKDRGCGY